MQTLISITVGGPAGAGIKSVGSIIAKVLMHWGWRVFEYPEYPSLIRGGHNSEQVVASITTNPTQRRTIDILLALNRQTINLHEPNLHEGSVIIYDSAVTSVENKSSRFLYIDIPMLALARGLGNDVMANNVGVGVILHLLDIDLAVVNSIIQAEFSDKKPEISQANIEATAAGSQTAKKLGVAVDSFHLVKGEMAAARYLMTGNDAIALGAVAGGVGLYAGYPMTPTSSLLHFLSNHQEEYGYIVRQPEDEIAVANMVIGAMHMGARAMCGTSGGGFALMNETLSLSGMTEIPFVVVLGQRPGPATGLPTWTEQGELRYAVSAGHGEFLRFILAPGDPLEAYQLAMESFNLAERYQAPVIILTDKYLGESAMTVASFDRGEPVIDRGEIAKGLPNEKLFPRYALTDSGISARTLPGTQNGVFCANSDEHDQTGLADETGLTRFQMQRKRLNKQLAAKAKLPGPTLIGPKDAPVTVITWGSTKLPACYALNLVAKSNMNVLHFSYLWPMNLAAIGPVLGKLAGQKSILLEGNATGQLASLLKEQLGFTPTKLVCRFDGRPFYPEDIAAEVESIL